MQEIEEFILSSLIYLQNWDMRLASNIISRHGTYDCKNELWMHPNLVSTVNACGFKVSLQIELLIADLVNIKHSSAKTIAFAVDGS